MKARYYSLKISEEYEKKTAYQMSAPQNIAARKANLDRYRSLVDKGECLPLFGKKDPWKIKNGKTVELVRRDVCWKIFKEVRRCREEGDFSTLASSISRLIEEGLCGDASVLTPLIMKDLRRRKLIGELV